MEKRIWKYIVAVLLAWVSVGGAGAQTTVSSEAELRNAIAKGGTIVLGADISLGSTLEISSGDIVLNLNGKTLSRTITKQEVKTVVVKGGTVIIRGGGIILAKTSYELGWTMSNDSYAIERQGGSLSLYDVTLKSTGFGVEGKNMAYTIYNRDGKIKDVVPYGVYLSGVGANDYDSSYTGADDGTLNQEQVTTVSLSIYTAHFDLAGGEGNFPDISSYTIDNNVYKKPEGKPTWKGYTFEGWKEPEGIAYVNDIPVLTDRAATGTVTFTAQWKAIGYKIAYNPNGGTLEGEETSYTIENEYELPTPTRTGYRFMGWKDSTGKTISKIEKGTTGDISLTAQWEEEYTVAYSYSTEEFESLKRNEEKFIQSELPGSFNLSSLRPIKEGIAFAGWYLGETRVTSVNWEWLKKNGNNKDHKVTLTARSKTARKLTLHWKESVTSSFSYAEGVETALPTTPEGTQEKIGYRLVGWKTAENGSTVITKLSGTEGYTDLWAAWELVTYQITYRYADYEGVTFPDNAKRSYNYEEDVTLPTPSRPGYTFIAWHENDQTAWSDKDEITGWKAGDKHGDKTFYAEWKAGKSLVVHQPDGGTITVKRDGKEIASGTVVNAKEVLVATVTAKSGFAFDKFIVNGNDTKYTTNPANITVSDTAGVTIYALMKDGRPKVKAPSVSFSPDNVSAIPAGGSVTVTLHNNESGATLYYSVNGVEHKYEKPFLLSSSKDAVMEVRGIARKENCQDGVSDITKITFGKGEVKITFNLLPGLKAVNPDGGEVVTAVATGATFTFKLDYDRNYIASLKGVKVYANGREMSRGTNNRYTLSDLKEDVVITAGNVSYNQRTVTLKQTAGGQIRFADGETAPRTVNHGDTLEIVAEANPGYFFTAWSDNKKDNPRRLVVTKTQEVSARFDTEKMVYLVTFPEIEGVEVKTLKGYSQQVEENGTCKFWLDISPVCQSSKPVVKANGKELKPTETGVYSLYYIRQHQSISVSGITRDPLALKGKSNTSIVCVETGKDATQEAVYADTQVMLYAQAPEGKTFLKWNDDVSENPRILLASDAQSVQPLFADAAGESVSLSFEVEAGAGFVSLDGNADAVEKGSDYRFKLVVLPQYSNSGVTVKADGKTLAPETKLRASTDSKTYVYTLAKVEKDMEITVDGLALNQYAFQVEQSEHGKVEATKSGSLPYGTELTVTATPEEKYLFLKWSDGNTLNPYPYTVTGDRTLKAEFIEADKMVVDNEEITAPDTRIYAANRTLYVETPLPSSLRVWNFGGALVHSFALPAGVSSCPLPAGDYLVQVGNEQAVKIRVR